ncbi:MAG: hypothetical protein RLP02_06155 [Coleofasciculus sp. C2-GNP5-27]
MQAINRLIFIEARALSKPSLNHSQNDAIAGKNLQGCFISSPNIRKMSLFVQSPKVDQTGLRSMIASRQLTYGIGQA